MTDAEFAEQMERTAYENHQQAKWLADLFDLLITARNSQDSEALQEAIDMVGLAASRDDEPTEAQQGLIPIPSGYAEQ